MTIRFAAFAAFVACAGASAVQFTAAEANDAVHLMPVGRRAVDVPTPQPLAELAARPAVVVYIINSPDHLRVCPKPYVDDSCSIAPDRSAPLHITRWVVKRRGQWLACVGPKIEDRCVPVTTPLFTW